MPKAPRRTRFSGLTKNEAKASRRIDKRGGGGRAAFDRMIKATRGPQQTTFDNSRAVAAESRIEGLQEQRSSLQEKHQKSVRDWQRRRQGHKFDLKVAQERARAVQILNGGMGDRMKAGRMGDAARARMSADTRPEFNRSRAHSIDSAVRRQRGIIAQGPTATTVPGPPVQQRAGDTPFNEASGRMGASPTVSEGPNTIAADDPFMGGSRSRFGGGLY